MIYKHNFIYLILKGHKTNWNDLQLIQIRNTNWRWWIQLDPFPFRLESAAFRGLPVTDTELYVIRESALKLAGWLNVQMSICSTSKNRPRWSELLHQTPKVFRLPISQSRAVRCAVPAERPRNAAKSTAWSTVNSGAPSVNGRRPALVSATDSST